MTTDLKDQIEALPKMQPYPWQSEWGKWMDKAQALQARLVLVRRVLQEMVDVIESHPYEHGAAEACFNARKVLEVTKP